MVQDGAVHRGRSWRGLVDKAAELIGTDDPELLRMRGSDLQILEYLRIKRGGMQPLINWLHASMQPRDEDIRRSVLHTALASLETCRLVYTTNYDDLIERAMRLRGRAVVSIAAEHDLSQHLAETQIVKFHGDFDRPAAMVLSESDYERRMRLESEMDLKLRSDILGRALLFIGYSFRDANVSVQARARALWGSSAVFRRQARINYLPKSVRLRTAALQREAHRSNPDLWTRSRTGGGQRAGRDGAAMSRIKVRYATGNVFKRQEIGLILEHLEVATHDGPPMRAIDAFDVEFPKVDTDEPLERNLVHMVRHKVRSAYRGIMAPCIAEHAGLILETLEDKSYPGGLTQPMWDALGAEGFVNSMRWAGERAIARAVVGYCDGLRVCTFVGETRGTLAPLPLGSRDFYWDAVFCPDDGGGLTYAQNSESASGLAEKVRLAQSTKAMSRLLSYLRANSAALFPAL